MTPFFDKRVARIAFRESYCMLEGGRNVPYLVAHEVAHVLVQELNRVHDHSMNSAYLADAYRDIYEEKWIDAEEHIVHRLAVLVSGILPTAAFWLDGPEADAASKEKSCIRRPS